MIGINQKLVKNSGTLVPKTPEPTFWLMLPRVSNIWTKSEILWNLLSNGLQRKESWLKRTWEVSDSTFWIASSTPMPSTEEEVKLFPPLEDCITLANLPLNPDFKSLFSSLKSPHQWWLWVVFIIVSIREEVLLTKKNKFKVLPSTWSDASYQSLNLSDSLLIWEVWLKDRHSLNVCSIIGVQLVDLHSMLEPNQMKLLTKSENEREWKKVSHLSKTISTSFE